MNVKEAAIVWGVTENTVRKYCQEGFVFGASKQGNCWKIPEGAIRPHYVKKIMTSSQEKREKIVLSAINYRKTIPLSKLGNSESEARAFLQFLITEGYVIKTQVEIESDDWFAWHFLSEKGKKAISRKQKLLTKFEVGTEFDVLTQTIKTRMTLNT